VQSKNKKDREDCTLSPMFAFQFAFWKLRRLLTMKG